MEKQRRALRLMMESRTPSQRGRLIREAEYINRRMESNIGDIKDPDRAMRATIAEARGLVESGHNALLVEVGLVPVLMGIAKLASGSFSDSEEKERTKKGVMDYAKEGAIDTIREKIAMSLAEMLGVGEDWAKAIGIVAGKLSIFDIPKLITDCEFAADIVVDVLLQFGGDYIKELFTDGDSGFFGDMIRAVLVEALTDTSLVNDLKDAVADYICQAFSFFTDEVKKEMTSDTSFGGGKFRGGGATGSF